MPIGPQLVSGGTRSLSLKSQLGRLRLLQTLSVCVCVSLITGVNTRCARLKKACTLHSPAMVRVKLTLAAIALQRLQFTLAYKTVRLVNTRATSIQG